MKTGNSESRSLERALLLFITLVFILGIVYVINIDFRNTAWPYQCILNQATGLLCPTCGGTRALSNLLEGNFLLAIRYNTLVIGAIPPVLFAFIIFARAVISPGRSPAGIYIHPFWIWAVLFLVLFYGIVRNLSFFNYLWYPFAGSLIPLL